MISFEWDKRKAHQNLLKHRVSFEEAATIFGDPLSLTIHDPIHSFGEHRFVTIGKSIKNRIIVAVHSDRGINIRIISARPAIVHERKNYEENT